MAYPAYIRERAIEMRIERHFSIDEIAERLALPKTTVYYWVRDLPLGRERRWTVGQERAAKANSEKYRLLREQAYQQGVEEFPALAELPTFREFVTLYVAEGYKRSRNNVAVGNSDPRVVAVCVGWMRRLSTKSCTFAVQYHADQDLDELRDFWSSVVAVAPEEITMQRKSNSNHLTGRTWRSEHGVLTARLCDTMFRARLQAWIDLVEAGWQLDSAVSNGV